MTDAPAPLDLVSAAHHAHVAVVGGGIAGLVAALECAKVGLTVTLFEAAPYLGGTIRAAQLDGIPVDLGPDGWARVGGHVRGLVDELGLGDLVTPASDAGAWVFGAPVGAAPLPIEAVLGIPANAWDPAVRRIIGWRGVWRAYLDRLRPPLTIGQEHNLDRLVRRRMGDLVVDRLLAPISVGRYGLAPAEIDVDVAAPGLNPALTRTGSLGGAVGQLRAEAPPGFETLDGGLAQLPAALAERLAHLGVRLRTGAAVAALAPAAGGWEVVSSAGTESVDAVIVAVDEGEARRLLAPHVPAVATPVAVPTQLVATLLLDAPELDAHPRGAVVYALPGAAVSAPGTAAGPAPDAVASVAHVSARWPWLAGRGGHVVRVSYRPGWGGEVDVAGAAAAASAFLGVRPRAVREGRVVRFTPAPPLSRIGRIAAADAVRTAVQAIEGLAVTGAWLAGSGLAQVVPDARAEAERVRRRALWGQPPVVD